MSILNQIWKRGNNEDSEECVTESLEKVIKRGHIVHVGTDAQKIGRRTDFVTVICLYDPEAKKGGQIWHTRSRMKAKMSIREKLFQETWLSLEAALGLIERSVVNSNQVMVHIDANPARNKRGDFSFESGHYAHTLAAMVMGNGFSYVLKPDAWAASHGADHLVKNRHLKGSSRPKRRRNKKQVA